MQKVSRRTDFAIIIVLLAIIVFAVVSALIPEKKGSDGEPGQTTLESYNGKILGTMAGSQYEAVTVKRFPDSRIVYYSGVPSSMRL